MTSETFGWPSGEFDTVYNTDSAELRRGSETSAGNDGNGNGGDEGNATNNDGGSGGEDSTQNTKGTIECVENIVNESANEKQSNGILKNSNTLSKKDAEKSRLATLKEATMFSFDFVDLETMRRNQHACVDRSEITYATSRASFQKGSAGSESSDVVLASSTPNTDGNKTLKAGKSPIAKPKTPKLSITKAFNIFNRPRSPKGSHDSGVVTSSSQHPFKQGSVESVDYSEDEVVTENVFYEPPSLWDATESTHPSLFASLQSELRDNVLVNTRNDVNVNVDVGDDESVYYEPPSDDVGDVNTNIDINKAEADKVVKRVSFSDEDVVIEEGDNVYENCDSPGLAEEGGVVCGSEGNTVTDSLYKRVEPSTNNTEELNHMYRTANGQWSEKACAIEMENARVSVVDVENNNNNDGGDHVYMNAEDVSRDFYVTPKYNYGMGLQVDDPKPEHIYDVPK